MKLLHTSDLHLGKRLHQRSLIEDQRHVLAQITQQIKDHVPDLFVVAGDVFDRSLPPEDAVALFGEWLGELREVAPSVPIVIIAGNHDSAKRIAWARSLGQTGRVYLRGIPETVEEPIHFETTDGEAVEVWALPFAWAGDLPSPQDEPSTQAGAFRTALDRIEAQRDSTRTQVLVAHCFAQGGATRDSERTLLGSATLIPREWFAPFDYVALGHLHAAQEVARNTWYSGSPLGYSFSEDSDSKGTLLVECSPGSSPTIRRLPLEPLHPLRRVSASLDALLEDATYESLSNSYLEVQLTTAASVSEPMAMLRARFPYILHLRPPASEAPAADVLAGDRTEATDLAADVNSFWEHVYGDAPGEEVLAALAICATAAEVA